jgi:hypothetical protein
MLSARLGSPDLRFIIVVIALLAFAVILGYYILAGLQMRREIGGPAKQQPQQNGALLASKSSDGNIDPAGVTNRPNPIVNAPNTSGRATESSPVQSPTPSSSAKGTYGLNKLLAELYETEEDSRRVVNNVGLDAGHIAFSNNALANWNNIIREASRRGRVPAIVEFACVEYPERASELKALV